MPKFVLIDHSLRDLGGHHYPYAYSVLAAAQRAGWQPVLVTHRRFEQTSALPAAWRVHALYSHESYSRYTLDTQAHLTAKPLDARSGPIQRLRQWWTERSRARLAARFARDTESLFARESVGPGDQIFFATMSELDLSGLTAFLGYHDPGLDCYWQLQFHFGVFRGREPDYAGQEAAAQIMRRSFIKALGQSGRPDLRFYCTTEQLTAQYRRLGVGSFGTLPYPVHELFRPRPTAHAAGAPLRIACLGHSRREKGYGQLPSIIRALWTDWLGPGRAQLVLQTRNKGLRRSLMTLVHSLPRKGAQSSGVLDFAGFPLPLAGYAQLLCSADVGLMLYDSTRYYARCSGVLLEMLCAGVPVLVPAGGWLSDQIEPANQRYLDEVAQHAPSRSPCAPDGWIDVANAERSLLIECRWREDAGPGEYLRLEFAMQDSSGASLPGAAAVVGPRDSDRPVRTLLRLAPDCARVHLSLSNAWQPSQPPATELNWALIPEAVPMGCLGLTVADIAQVPRLLQDVLEHHGHYRSRTVANAANCAASHSGLAVLAALGAHVAPGIAEPGATT